MIPVRGTATSVLVFVLLQLHVLQAQQLYAQPSHNVGKYTINYAAFLHNNIVSYFIAEKLFSLQLLPCKNNPF